MVKAWTPIALVGFSLMLNGCGGSGGSSGSAAGGAAMSQYQATLPDGSLMEIEILDDSNGVWAGEFAVAAETGPYAHQTGSFEGRASGSSLSATCEMSDGTEFQMTGTSKGSQGFQLTRSDIPGSVLTFTPVAQAAPASRADVSFQLTTGGTNGRVNVSSTPYSIQAGGTMTEYGGTWQGVPCTYWSYSSGYGSLVIYIDPLCISIVNFANYKLSDFPTATVTSASSQMTMYSTVVKAQIKFKTSCTASP